MSVMAISQQRQYDYKILKALAWLLAACVLLLLGLAL
jgi:uncharacterized membrane protein